MSEQSASRPRHDPEAFVISDVEGLKAIAEPLRFQLLMAIAESDSTTVKELAARLDVPQTRLYYHVGILERSGLIRVASKRLVSGIEERRYEATAKNWSVDPALASQIGSSGVLKAA